MSLRRKMAFATAISLLGSVIAVAASYLRNWMTARALGPDQIGTLLLAVTIINWSVAVLMLGMNVSISKFVAERTSDMPAVRGGARWALRMGAVSGVVGMILIVLAAWPLGHWVFRQEPLTGVLVTLALGVPFAIMLAISNGVSLGLGHVGHQVVANSIAMPLIWLAVVGFAWVLDLGLLSFAAALSVAWLISAAIGFLLAQRAMGTGNARIPHGGSKAIVVVGSAVFVFTVANYLWLWMGNVMLGLFWSPREVGLYALTFQFAFMLTYVIAAVSSFFAPAVASLLAQGSHRQLEMTSNEVGMWCGYGNLPIAITLFIGAEWFLSLFGASFAVTEAQWSLRILAACFLVYSILGAMPANVLSMGGQHKKNAWIEVAMVPLVFVLHMVVSRRLGVVGAAMVTGISLTIVGVLRSLVVRKDFGYWQIRRVDVWRFGAVGVASMLFAGGANYLVQDTPPVAGLLIILIAAVSGELLGLWLVREPLALKLAHEMKVRLTDQRGVAVERSTTVPK